MLSARNIAALGFMTFAMYLGAGNLIFPPYLGYQAGDNFLSGMTGFLLTGVGLPAIALVIVAWVRGSDNLTAALPKPLATSFWVMLFIVIGPAFIIPRTITVAYQFSLAPFMGDAGLIPFSITFCIAAILFSLYPGKLVDTLGKWLTPILLTILGVMAVVAVLYPSGYVTEATGAYVNGAMAEGLTQGYMTMDALGSIGFGWVIFRAIEGMGVKEPKAIAKYTFIAALMYSSAMALVYLSLAYIGVTSEGLGLNFTNGGEILTAFTNYHFGVFGTLLLGAVLVLACLTTAIGVTTAGSEFYSRTFTPVTYRKSVIIIMVLSGIIANVGLSQLLKVTLPVVVALHPIAISLLIIAPLRHQLSQKMVLATLAVAMIFGCIDATHILEAMPAQMDKVLEANLPLYHYYAGWILPTVITLVIGLIAQRLTVKRQVLTKEY
ncbi:MULTISPECIES: branched-chain amino acid transport system II carrier protein [unclassified Photobacterium]|uniref:branched-chain amino acid transport system II carrier protein n=1 Tax=unclassified Photobacterium TaxID=2628852 RepID=UPI001EDCDA5E|nr:MULTISPECIES: branched-chain amino acid transport system II carrier protein [unclassified Photobacterium]MCG3865035.1 branched-chain amino acid transport system II carrier protein [Photobacterium sp. Ph6]MCG3876489.1 branched-chain amino acid transport system II carrier protein [Photobacterium sp. Ph5]